MPDKPMLDIAAVDALMVGAAGRSSAGPRLSGDGVRASWRQPAAAHAAVPGPLPRPGARGQGLQTPDGLQAGEYHRRPSQAALGRGSSGPSGDSTCLAPSQRRRLLRRRRRWGGAVLRPQL